jgi:3-dehydroquinate synthase
VIHRLFLFYSLPYLRLMSKASFHHSDEHLALELQRKMEGASQVFLLTDSNVAEFVLPRILPLLKNADKIDIIEVEPGEASKALDVCHHIFQHLIEAKAGRDALLINLGGGVITDLGGFIASVYKRGIPFIHIPTSLMGMCDAAIGGKTGIDLLDVKNVIGSFAYPKAVLIQPNFIETLPLEHIKSGFAEMVKHAIIADPQLFDALEVIDIEEPHHIALFIERSTRIKEDVVMEDFMEEGKRKILNFGHTIGHAIESFSLSTDSPLSHGHAVALGILVEAKMSYHLGGLDLESYTKIQRLLTKSFQFPDNCQWEDILPFLFNDKKNKNNQVRFAIPKKMGSCDWDVAVDLEEARAAFEELINE